MNPIQIRSAADLDALPRATERAAYLSDDSLGSAEVRRDVSRVIATLIQDVSGDVKPEKLDRLPALVGGARAGLEAEGLELWAEVPEPGVAPIAMHFGDNYTKVLDATLVRIRFVIRSRAES